MNGGADDGRIRREGRWGMIMGFKKNIMEKGAKKTKWKGLW